MTTPNVNITRETAIKRIEAALKVRSSLGPLPGNWLVSEVINNIRMVKTPDIHKSYRDLVDSRPTINITIGGRCQKYRRINSDIPCIGYSNRFLNWFFSKLGRKTGSIEYPFHAPSHTEELG